VFSVDGNTLSFFRVIVGVRWNGNGTESILIETGRCIWKMKRGYYKKLHQIWRSLEGIADTGKFDESMVKELPNPAIRYLLHSIQPGSPLSSCVQLQMSGEMRLKPDGAWMSMKAQQILAPPQGFIWIAHVAKGFSRITGADYYFEGNAGLRFWLWGLIPVVNASGADINQSAAGRLAIESVWLPASLLPQQGAVWEEIDNEHVKVIVPIGQFKETLILSIGSNGALNSIEMLRWGDKTEDGTFARIPFGGTVEAEDTFGGYTIPTRMTVGWWPNSNDYFDFFRADIDEAEFGKRSKD